MSAARKIAHPHGIPAGYDLFQTAPGSAVFMFQRVPIPAGFFSERSRQFTRVVRFRGRPLASHHFNGLQVTHVDTIVHRKAAVELRPPYPCSSASVPIEIVALALESVEPLEIRVGRHIELWDASAELSPNRPSEGHMIIAKTSPDGGTFDSELTVFPVIRFVRRCDGEERLLDVGALPLPDELLQKFTMRSRESPWLHETPHALRIHGLNDNFVAGAPGKLEEEGEATLHEPDEPQPCTVDIRADSTCLCVGQTRAFTAQGSPGGSGSSYSWSIVGGSDRARIAGGRTEQTVIVEGIALSGAANDITLGVEYGSPDGSTCVATIDLTTIRVDMSFNAVRMDDLDQAQPPEVQGGRVIGPVSPGQPQGCDGFYKKVEIKGTVTPNDPTLSCRFRFRQLKQGFVGYSDSTGPHGDPQENCPAPGWCEDDPLNIRGQDITPSSEGTIFMVDGPGIGLGGSLECHDPSEIQINCLNFRAWVEVDQQKCSQELNWFATTRLVCDQGRYRPDFIGNALGEGSVDCSMGGPELGGPADLASAMELLEAESAAERMSAYHAIASASETGGLQDSHRGALISQLLRLAAVRATRYPLQSPPMLAMRLLGLMRVQEAAGVLMEQLVTEFPRLIVDDRDLPPMTVAGRALASLGMPALDLAIESAGSATDEEWAVLEAALMLADDQMAIRRSVCRVLDSDIEEVHESRLSRLACSITP